MSRTLLNASFLIGLGGLILGAIVGLPGVILLAFVAVAVVSLALTFVQLRRDGRLGSEIERLGDGD